MNATDFGFLKLTHRILLLSILSLMRTEGGSIRAPFRDMNHLRKDSKLVMYSKQSSAAYSTFKRVNTTLSLWSLVHDLQMLETNRIEARIRKKLTIAWGGLLCKCQLESHQHSAVHTCCLLRDKHGKYICTVYILVMGSWQGWHVLQFCFPIYDSFVNIKLQHGREWLLISKSYIN